MSAFDTVLYESGQDKKLYKNPEVKFETFNRATVAHGLLTFHTTPQIFST
jgi:hypothetical protein